MAFNPGGGGLTSATDVAVSAPGMGNFLGFDTGVAKWRNMARPSQLTENVNTVAAAGSAQTLPAVTTATIHVLKLSATNCSVTLPTPVAGQSFLVVLSQDGTGSRKVSWTGVWWQAGATPVLTTTANKSDVFSFIAVDNAKWLGFQVGQNF